MERKVIKIAARPVFGDDNTQQTVKRQVAAYARVSTSSEEQLASFEAQKDYYLNYIQAHPNWEFAGLYSDEGVSGVSAKKRKGFNAMIQAALAGSIDLIITKSISRFARNTVDTLTAIRMLKENGIEVFFEKENIFTFDAKGELMLTILSSIAQEESRSISENVKWGRRKRMADGNYYMPYKCFLGYRKGTGNKPEVVVDEARIIRYIYRLCLEGRAASNIAALLNAEGILSPACKRRWQSRTVHSILTNEKYYGAALMQKTYKEDFMAKKARKNNGELPQYYVEQGHEPIVSREVFMEVQHRLNQPGRLNGSHNAFANKLFCRDCGGKYGRKIWSSNNDKYRHAIWICNQKYDQAEKCRVPHLYEEVITYAFNEAVQSRLRMEPGLIHLCRKLLFRSIKARKPATKAERQLMIDDYLSDFLAFSPKDIPFNDAAWRIIIDRADITRERIMILRFIDGSEYNYVLPNYSQIKKKAALT